MIWRGDLVLKSSIRSLLTAEQLHGVLGSFSRFRRKRGNQKCHGTCHGHVTGRNRAYGTATRISGSFVTLALEVLMKLSRKSPRCERAFDCNALIFKGFWWLWVDSNHRPQHYECCALTG